MRRTVVPTPTHTPPHPRDAVLRCDPSRPPPINWELPAIELDTRNLPPLPEIHDSALRRQIFLQKSRAIVSPAEPDLAVELRSNKRSETLGDSIIYHRATEAVYLLCPGATSGVISTIRSRMVQNKTISYLSWAYGLGERLIEGDLRHARGVALNRDQDVLADLFEAYIGGLRVDSGCEESQSTSWLTQLFSPAVFTTLSEQADTLTRRAVEARAAKDASARAHKAARSRDVDDDQGDAERGGKHKVMRLAEGVCDGIDGHHAGADALVDITWKDDGPNAGGWHSRMFYKGEFLACGSGKKMQEARMVALASHVVVSRQGY